MKQGVIFDMDGVLLNNVEYHLEAFRLFGLEQGKNLTREDVSKVFGRKNADMLSSLLDRELTPAEVQKYEGRKEEFYRELIKPTLKETVVDGLFEFLDHLNRNGWKKAVATSGPMENVKFVLEGLGMEGTFDALITSENVRNGKPHPEAFLKAAAALDLRPELCFVIEDSFSGVMAGMSSGGKTIALSTTHTREELLSLNPDLILDDFVNLTVERLTSL